MYTQLGMPITTIIGGSKPVSNVILKPNKAKVPNTHVTTIPIIIKGTNTVSRDLKNKNRIIATTIIENNNNLVSSFLTLSANIYLEYGRPA